MIGQKQVSDLGFYKRSPESRSKAPFCIAMGVYSWKMAKIRRLEADLHGIRGLRPNSAAAKAASTTFRRCKFICGHKGYVFDFDDYQLGNAIARRNMNGFF